MNRPDVRAAIALTVLGLLADLAYFAIHIATWFLLDGMWAEGLAFTIVGGSTVAWVSSMGISRARAILWGER